MKKLRLRGNGLPAVTQCRSQDLNLMLLHPRVHLLLLLQLLLSEEWFSFHFAVEASPLPDPVNCFSYSIPEYLVLSLASATTTKTTKMMIAIISVVFTVHQALFQVRYICIDIEIDLSLVYTFTHLILTVCRC